MPFERGSVLGIVPGYGLCRFGETCSVPPQGDMPVAISFWFCSGKTYPELCSIKLARLPPVMYILNAALPERELFSEDVRYYLCTLLLSRVDPAN